MNLFSMSHKINQSTFLILFKKEYSSNSLFPFFLIIKFTEITQFNFFNSKYLLFYYNYLNLNSNYYCRFF